ncbi:MAG: BON domain-containing protein [Candidatus Lokiarchaeota archaeon]|nr:BON domain-containing protein [Candidatus Lokiarchaeota archaeon]
MVQSDETIKKNIIDELFWDAKIDASDVKVEVNNRRVTLNGKVSTYSEHARAFSDAWAIKGVNEVVNNLKVEFKPTFVIPSDEDIKSSIESILLWDTSVDSSEIEVKVTGGIVTLIGNVDAYWKIIHIEELIWNVNGIIDLINKIAVVPTEDFIDKEIAESIVNAIARKINVSVNDVDVKVHDGEVELLGTIPDYRAYQAAMNAATYTNGVVNVEDKLVIE